MVFRPSPGSQWQRFELARRRRERAQSAHAAVGPRAPCRTSFDDVLPWESAGFTLQPPPPAPNYDTMDPLSPAEFMRLIRKFAHDPSNRTAPGKSHKVIPIASIAHACGYHKNTLWHVIASGQPPKPMLRKMSPLLRKLDAGVVRFVWRRTKFHRGWELENVVDPALSR